MVKVGIIGATGYAGAELVRILLNHKEAQIEWFGSRSYIDENYADIYRNFFELVDADCLGDNMDELASRVDVIFTCVFIWIDVQQGQSYESVQFHIERKDTIL